MEHDTFLTIETTSQGIYKEKGSKFLAFAYPVRTLEEVKNHLQNLRKTYYDARHWCYAYILGKDKGQYRANDDGEPSGSAGLPILGQLKSKNVTNVLVIVVRYFGGTKLGVSGLIHAYKTVTAEALENASIIEEIVQDEVTFTFEYLQMNDVMKLIKEYQLNIKNQKFDNQCEMTIWVRQKLTTEIRSKLQKIPHIQILNIE